MESDINNQGTISDYSLPINPQTETKHSRKRLLFIAIIILLLLIISSAGILYLLINKNDTKIIKNINTSPTGIIQKSEIPEINKVVFKSDTEEYLKYKYLTYDIQSGQISEMPSQATIDIDTNYRVANDLKHYFIVTEKELFIAPTGGSVPPAKVFSIPTTNPPESFTENIETHDTKWSADGSRLVFLTSKILGLDSRKYEVKIYTISADGTDLKLIKTLITEKLNVIRSYNSENKSLYFYSFIDDDGEFKGTTEIIDAENGSIKGMASFMDDKEIVDDIIFSPDMRYAYYRKERDQKLQLIQYDFASSTERILYTFGNSGGNFLISLQKPLIILIIFDKGKMLEVELLNYETNIKEKLYSSSEYEYMPLSISPNGHFIWTEDREDYNKSTYAIFDLKTRTMIPLKFPEGMIVKLSAMERINWLP